MVVPTAHWPHSAQYAILSKFRTPQARGWARDWLRQLRHSRTISGSGQAVVTTLPPYRPQQGDKALPCERRDDSLPSSYVQLMVPANTALILGTIPLVTRDCRKPTTCALQRSGVNSLPLNAGSARDYLTPSLSRHLAPFIDP